MTTVALAPTWAAAQATAAPWLPAVTATSPRSRASSGGVISRLSAPRALKEPVFWTASSLTSTRAPVRSSSVAEVSTGVRCTRPAIRAAADRTAAGFTSAPFEQPPGWRDGAQHSPGVDGPSRPWYQTSDVCVGRIVRRPLAAPRTETAIARIRDLITSGELAPGSRLPPEQELAAQLGLSRN